MNEEWFRDVVDTEPPPPAPMPDYPWAGMTRTDWQAMGWIMAVMILCGLALLI